MRILRGFNPIYKLHACTRALEYYVDTIAGDRSTIRPAVCMTVTLLDCMQTRLGSVQLYGVALNRYAVN